MQKVQDTKASNWKFIKFQNEVCPCNSYKLQCLELLLWGSPAEAEAGACFLQIKSSVLGIIQYLYEVLEAESVK